MVWQKLQQLWLDTEIAATAQTSCGSPAPIRTDWRLSTGADTSARLCSLLKSSIPSRAVTDTKLSTEPSAELLQLIGDVTVPGWSCGGS